MPIVNLFALILQLQQFQFPVSKTQNPGYSDVIVNPMNLSKIENKIENLEYTNSEAFLSDIKWILHNCSIYFSGMHLKIMTEKTLKFDFCSLYKQRKNIFGVWCKFPATWKTETKI